jgi:hypothetical protein
MDKKDTTSAKRTVLSAFGGCIPPFDISLVVLEMTAPLRPIERSEQVMAHRMPRYILERGGLSGSAGVASTIKMFE